MVTEVLVLCVRTTACSVTALNVSFPLLSEGKYTYPFTTCWSTTCLSYKKKTSTAPTGANKVR